MIKGGLCALCSLDGDLVMFVLHNIAYLAASLCRWQILNLSLTTLRSVDLIDGLLIALDVIAHGLWRVLDLHDSVVDQLIELTLVRVGLETASDGSSMTTAWLLDPLDLTASGSARGEIRLVGWILDSV